MTHLVPGRWVAAARWSDRFDFRGLLDRLGGPDGFAAAGADELGGLGVPPRLVEDLQSTPDLSSSRAWMHIGGAGYPPALLDLPRPPPVLWWLGDPGLLESPAVAVVGSRTCTSRGRDLARRIGAAVAQAGGVVVSGAARGIDSEAHRGSFAGGHTVAVLGAGIDARVGSAARGLRRAIVEHGGLLVSEMAPCDGAERWTFPRRNRLIAALGLFTVVVEAGQRSGALITAHRALEIGREVIVVPGSIDAPASRGCLKLLSEGASCLCAVGDVVERLGSASRPDSTPLSRLTSMLRVPATPAELSRRLDIPVADLLRSLSMLELAGGVRRLLDGRYVLP